MSARRLAHDRHGADEVEAGRVRRHDNLAHPPVGRRIRIRYAHHDGEGRAHGSPGEPLVAVDHPLIAVTHRARGEAGGIRACRVGLGHRVAAAHRAGEHRPEPAALLLVGAVLGEDFHVAGVGRLAVERRRSDRAPPHQLAQRSVLEVADAGAVPFVGQEEVPQALGFGLLA